jgi:hypothetical protein
MGWEKHVLDRAAVILETRKALYVIFCVVNHLQEVAAIPKH